MKTFVLVKRLSTFEYRNEAVTKQDKMHLDDMKLPKVNKRLMESKRFRYHLKIAIAKAITDTEISLGYSSEPYEVDDVLLDKVKSRHEAYIKIKFEQENTEES